MLTQNITLVFIQCFITLEIERQNKFKKYNIFSKIKIRFFIIKRNANVKLSSLFPSFELPAQNQGGA
ncbi:hypothetical protein LEP1GSC193_0655 [Leptospira alstonii serovar Pingchang str. 80-412]|uniref:Uncharacterized protein n=2 Tax=Leptospira alstonii TaxID=28452 RepID=M6CRZ4_9LEPT|nr:hypothetical protein LEP1GSC194_1573 [Leptospira alstonii serovar Sichuan str. 79601]EQA82172.1 hypothetical protein LEP1GSC193_0655 [Leptospira alstonii serovar Pingchang str. 80-412]